MDSDSDPSNNNLSMDAIISQSFTVTPLIHPEITSGDAFSNILLIHNEIADYDKFVSSANSSTFPIVYSMSSSKAELLALLQQHFLSIQRIGICFHSSSGNTKIFLDRKPLFTEEDIVATDGHYSENMEWLLNVIKDFHVQNIDFLACNSLQYPNWVKYFDLLGQGTNVVVGASDDKTGNLKYGGDWIMENTNEDVESLYFTPGIAYYQYLLDSTVIDNISYTLNPSNNTAIVDDGNRSRDFTLNNPLIIPSTVTSDGITYTVNLIGNNAFQIVNTLTNITIPNTVTAINDFGFYRCPNLTSIYFSNSLISIGLAAFHSCKNLNNIYIPNSVTSIDQNAFYNCVKLNYVYFLSSTSLPSITSGAFNNGPSPKYAYCLSTITNTSFLTDHEFTVKPGLGYDGIIYTLNNSNNTAILNTSNQTRDFTLNVPLTIPTTVTYDNISYSVTSIESSAFQSNSSLTSISIPNNITSIGYGVFMDCTSLLSVSISTGIKNLPSNAFNGCTSLVSVTIPNSVTGTTDGLFAHCASLTNVTISNALLNIGAYTFEDCPKLTSVSIPNSVTSIGYNAFYGCNTLSSVYFMASNIFPSINESAFNTISGLTRIGYYMPSISSAPETVNGFTVIQPMFNYLVSTSAITITSLMDTVDKLNIRAIYIPNTILTPSGDPYPVTSIGNSAFQNCNKLVSINIASSISSIGENVFNGCSNLSFVIFLQTDTIPTIGSGAFTSIGPSPTAFCNPVLLAVQTEIDKLTTAGFVNANIYQWNYQPELSYDYIDGNQAVVNSANATKMLFYVTSIPSSVMHNDISHTVTRIADNAFNNNRSLISISIPISVTTIGSSAFYGCTNLSIIELSLNHQITKFDAGTFRNCTNLLNITIPNSVTTLGDSLFQDCVNLLNVNISSNSNLISIIDAAFHGCSKLSSIFIPSGVSSIKFAPYNVFGNCPNLSNVIIDPNNQYYSYSNGTFFNKNENILYSFLGKTGVNSYIIPNSVTSIDNRAFYNSAFLSSIIIPNTVISINYGAFYSCTSLTGITIPNSVTAMVGAAFVNCNSLTSVSMPNNITSIGDELFAYCYSLTSISIPNSVTSIGTYAFRANRSLTSIIIGNSVISIGNEAFLECNSLRSVIIGNSVTSIGSQAFYSCSSLKNISIPNSVTSIGSSALSQCSSLTSVSISNRLTRIDDYVFHTCPLLNNVYIPNSVTSIGYNSFYFCSALKYVYFLSSTSLPSLRSDSFSSGASPKYAYCLSNISDSDTNALTDQGFTVKRGLGYDGIIYTLNNSNNTAILNTSNQTRDFTLNVPLTIPNTITYDNISYSVTSIGSSAFQSNSSLTSISIPNNISSIGTSAFQDCSGMTYFYFSTTTALPTFNISNTFTGTSSSKIAYCFPTINTSTLQDAGFTMFKAWATCFKEDSKILTDKGYIPIQDLRRGDLVKTLNNDYLPINMIGKSEMYHPRFGERCRDQLYRCSNDEYPEIFEDLVITGCHSILIDDFEGATAEEKAVMAANKNRFMVDGKYKLPARMDKRATVYEIEGNYTIYHLALDNEDDDANYGIYANGLLVESCSKKYLMEMSNMTLL